MCSAFPGPHNARLPSGVRLLTVLWSADTVLTLRRRVIPTLARLLREGPACGDRMICMKASASVTCSRCRLAAYPTRLRSLHWYSIPCPLTLLKEWASEIDAPGPIRVLRILLERGAKVGLEDRWGRVPSGLRYPVQGVCLLIGTGRRCIVPAGSEAVCVLIRTSRL